jgi:type II secretory pathway pseudopilin PulG
MSRQAGYTLIELLISTLITCSLLGVLLQLAAAGQHATRAQSEVVDLQQRLRVAIDRLSNDLLAAGAGPSGASWHGSLLDFMAPIVPARTGARGADIELSHHADRISIRWVPDPPGQTTILTSMATPGEPLMIDASAHGCAGGGDCGYSPGDRALIVDPADPERASDMFVVSSTLAGQLKPASTLSKAYPAGSLVMKVVQRVYYLDRAGGRLMVYDGDSSDLPLLDHVVDLRFAYYAERPGLDLEPLAAVQITDGPVRGAAPHRFDADLLRIRRVRVTLRLEAAADELRGSGASFLRSGTSLGGIMYVPDVQVTFDVAPRNMNLFR